MDAGDSPFPLGWYTPGGHRDFWGDGGTHDLVPYENLPPINRAPLGDPLAWLQQAPPVDDGLDFCDANSSPRDTLARLAGEANRSGLSFPDSFASFLTNADLHRRMPTCTACCLSLSDRLIGVPGGAPGRLVRFMNDQQCVLLWYLHVVAGHEPAVVVGTPRFDDEEHGESLDDAVRITELCFCAPTFEEFVRRFWIENTIWYSLIENRPLTFELAQYLDVVRRVRNTPRR